MILNAAKSFNLFLSVNVRRSKVDLSWFSAAGMVMGACVVVLSMSWMALSKPEHVWSPEQAREFKDANEGLHAAISGLPASHRRNPHPEFGPSEDRIETAQKRFDYINLQLAGAREVQGDWGRWGVLGGAMLILISGLVHRAFSKPVE